MAGVKVTDLPSLASADPADIFYVVDDSSGQSKKIDLATIITALGTALPYIHLRGTAFTGIGQVTGDIEVDVSSGGLMTLRFPNGDIIGLGVDYGGNSALSFFDATINETCYLYLRGGDLFIENVDTGQGTGALIGQILALNSSKIGFSDSDVDVVSNNGTIGIVQYPNSTSNAYWQSNVLGRVGYRKLTNYFAKYSAYISQSGTSAPTENHIIESDFANPNATSSYSWAYVGVGHYHLNITGGIGGFDVNSNKTLVRVINGTNQNVSISTEIAQVIPNGLQISIKTANPQTGNLTNGLITQSLIEVEFYS